jgi:hypothetical protein
VFVSVHSRHCDVAAVPDGSEGVVFAGEEQLSMGLGVLFCCVFGFGRIKQGLACPCAAVDVSCALVAHCRWPCMCIIYGLVTITAAYHT